MHLFNTQFPILSVWKWDSKSAKVTPLAQLAFIFTSANRDLHNKMRGLWTAFDRIQVLVKIYATFL